jgi:MFS superfamily sulfate permease-like transporter
MKNLFSHIDKDLSSSIVVFFVALPLCLGIALASGAPLFAGVIAGIIGGIVVGSISGSSLGVSGPAAGLAVIVLQAISDLGSYEIFLTAVVIGGLLQILLGVLRAGVIAYYFPNSVIRGMLAGIGVIIFLKQLPIAFGYNVTSDDGTEFFINEGENTFTEIFDMFSHLSVGAILVSLISLVIILLWETKSFKSKKFFQLVPGPLVAVFFGILYFSFVDPNSFLAISRENLVSVPVPDDFGSFVGQFTTPSFASFFNYKVWVVAITIAIVASLETLLCVEATDKLDPEKRTTPTNRELYAQGIGNTLSGLIGGLPITQVIVRSSANIQAGGKTKLSAIIHGFLLLISVILIPRLLNMIPLPVLAAVLLVIGYKLAKPALFKTIYRRGIDQFLPFIVTVLGIVFFDLLLGIGLGLGVGITTILISNYKNSHFLHIKEHIENIKSISMVLSEEVSFLNKGAIIRELNNIPENTNLEIDVTNTTRMNYDIVEILDDFASTVAKSKNINLILVSERGRVENPKSFSEFFGFN